MSNIIDKNVSDNQVLCAIQYLLKLQKNLDDIQKEVVNLKKEIVYLKKKNIDITAEHDELYIRFQDLGLNN
jgi:hypothetical protein